MEWVETTGRTLEEAKDAALDQLGVDEADAEFEILEEPKVGLFGRLRTEARVRARVRPTKPRPKEERRDRRRRRDEGTRIEGTRAEASSAPAAAEEPEPLDTPPPPPQEQIRRRAEVATDAAPNGRNGGSSVEANVPMGEQGEVAAQFVDGLLHAMGVQGSVAVREVDEETVEVALEGADLGLLIGPKGGTLNALQEITRTVVQRRTGARNGRVMVDVAGYRQKRREALERFTRQQAEQALATGQRRVLEPMHAADRKVVHDIVNEIDGVSTVSEGEEPRRRVVIVPDS